MIVKEYLFFWLTSVMELYSSKNTWAKAFFYFVLIFHLKISFMKLNFSEGINQWVLVPVQCQQESSCQGVVKKIVFSGSNSIVIDTARLWNSTAMEQLSSVTAQLRGSPLRLDSSAMLCSALVQQNVFIVSAPVREKQFCSPSHKGSDLHREKCLPLAPDWSSLMQTRTPNPQFDQSKDTVLIGQNGATAIGQ